MHSRENNSFQKIDATSQTPDATSSLSNFVRGITTNDVFQNSYSQQDSQSSADRYFPSLTLFDSGNAQSDTAAFTGTAMPTYPGGETPIPLSGPLLNPGGETPIPLSGPLLNPGGETPIPLSGPLLNPGGETPIPPAVPLDNTPAQRASTDAQQLANLDKQLFGTFTTDIYSAAKSDNPQQFGSFLESFLNDSQSALTTGRNTENFLNDLAGLGQASQTGQGVNENPMSPSGGSLSNDSTAQADANQLNALASQLQNQALGDIQSAAGQFSGQQFTNYLQALGQDFQNDLNGNNLPPPPEAPIPPGLPTPPVVPTPPENPVPPVVPPVTNPGSGPLPSSGPDGAWGGQTAKGQMVDGYDLYQGASWYLNSRPTGPASSASALDGFNIQTQHSGGSNDYNSPIQAADGSNGYQTFRVKNVGGGWGNAPETISIPIPKGGFKPATGTDGHLDVFDPKTGQYWSVWQMDTANGTVSSADVGNNIFTSNGFGNTASGLAASVGEIMPGELDTANSLTHAVSMSLPGDVLNNMISNETAASHSDGYNSAAAAPFSEGGKFGLPADFDPAAHGIKLTTAGMAIVNALKNYGGIISDRNDAGSKLIGINSDYKTSPDLGDINAIIPYLQYYGGTKQTQGY